MVYTVYVNSDRLERGTFSVCLKETFISIQFQSVRKYRDVQDKLLFETGKSIQGKSTTINLAVESFKATWKPPTICISVKFVTTKLYSRNFIALEVCILRLELLVWNKRNLAALEVTVRYTEMCR